MSPAPVDIAAPAGQPALDPGVRWRTTAWSEATAWGLVALSGLLAAAATPRGPATGAAVAALFLAATFTGVVAGAATSSRWVVVTAPLLHVALWEAGRATVFRLDGPTFGRPHFDVELGVLVFVAVHVMYALLTGLPLMFGVLVGRGLRRRRRWAWVWPAAAILAVGSLVVVLIRPAQVAPVRMPDGSARAGSVATLEKVRLGGTDQWVSLRGNDARNPVLLHLSGGPGSSDVGWVRTFNQPLEEHFTVAVWEQRGAGKSYPALDPTSGLTLDRLVADGLELSAWLSRRFDEPKIYLTGNSWGSTLGILMVQRRPDLFHAYVGTGQMVSQFHTDRLLYQQLTSYAVSTGDDRLRKRLVAIGAPPYRDVLSYALVMQYYDVLEPYRRVPAFEAARGIEGFLPDEYSLLDTWNEIRGFADMGGLLYPQLQGIDFRRDVKQVAIPVYFAQGRHELTARGALAREWLDQLRAPVKRVYEFEQSGHNADAEEPRRYNDLLINTVLPETYPR